VIFLNNYIIKKNNKINYIYKNKINYKNNYLLDNLFQVEYFLNGLSCFFKAGQIYKILKK